ncbi:MAG TPA: adenylate/guanylate cyclase domain-containing protein, partial [Ktedonobacteraceae bacterium]|nr:adenylate/guanylate cyclase domain-containing protein [Ktedonobacteraceae bacterium]
MRCPNCQTENPRGAKFCLECGNRLLVCPNCGTVNLPVAKFCIECGTSLRTLDPRATQPTLPAVQAPGIDQPGLPQPEERRVVTIMFADITGSTPLADRLDPEDMRAILAGYFNLMTEQIRKHGGTVEKYIGDAVMAVFGVPLTHEDDPDRAIRAALDMQAALAQFNQQRQQQDTEATRLQMRIGINTGEVAAAPGSRQDFLITGDAVNVAARLQQTAAPDTILIGERTYLTTREVFDFRAIAPLHLKGKNEAIHAWVVLGLHKSTTIITQHPRGIEGLRAPLVGRRLELAMMHATYARVQNERHPHLITLLGLPGIGKTRLVREFIAREKEAAKSASATKSPVFPHVLQGRCPPYGEGITYWPLVEILRSIIGAEDTADNDTIQRLFIDFVVDTLTEAKSNEDPLQIAAAIARSVGSGLGGQINDPLYTDRLEREHQRSIHNKNRNIEQSGPRTALQRAWRVLLEALAQKHPLILVIDDLQWADEALLDLLEYLTDRITDVPILFICPARPEFIERRREWGGGQRNFTTINLESLSSSESSELVDALLHTDDLPGVLRQTILARAEGNPFFVEEIVRMLIDQGVLIYKNGCWYIGSQTGALFSELANPATHPVDNLIDQHYAFPLPQVPDTIQGVLAARIDLLNKVEKNVLQHAAIISRSFWLSALLELASGLSKEAIVQALDSLIERDFIVETERKGRSPIEDDRVFSFKHVLIRDVVYNNTPRTRRSYEHAQLALWLEKITADHSDTYVELLAYHYQQAFNTWSASLLTNALASRGSGTVYRANSAARLTRPELRRRAIHYLTRAGDLALHSYYTIRAIQAYGEALDLLSNSSPDPLTLSRMHKKLGNAYAQRANADEAWQEYVQSLKLRIESLSQEPDEEEHNGLLRLYERLAELGTRWLGWFDKAPSVQEVRTYIDEGLKLLEGRTPGRSHVAFLTYQALWYILQCNASPGRRAELVDQALRSGQEGYRIAEEIQDVPSLWLTLDALGYIYRKHHRYQEALKAQERRLELAPQIESREELHDLYASLGRIYTSVSNYAAAAHWFGQAWNIAQTMESPSMLLDSMNGRMFAWYYWNHWQDANEVAQRMLQMTEQY